MFGRAAPAEETRFIAQRAIAADVVCTPLSHQDNWYGRETPKGIIMHDFGRTAKTNIQAAGVSGVCRDLILGHSLQGMDTHYIVPSEETLTQAMDKYTRWLDDQIAKSVASVDQNVDQRAYYVLNYLKILISPPFWPYSHHRWFPAPICVWLLPDKAP